MPTLTWVGKDKVVNHHHEQQNCCWDVAKRCLISKGNN